MRPLVLLLSGASLLAAAEPTLRELAATAVVTGKLQAGSPQPDRDAWPVGPAMTVTSLGMRTTLWGPPDRPTLSIMRNDVWDRRTVKLHVPTLAEITEGAFAPANRSLPDLPATGSTRPASLGWLVPTGGYTDPFRPGQRKRYPFPCQKPVGQVIIQLDGLGAAGPVSLAQSCADGTTGGVIEDGAAKARIDYVLGISSGIIGLRVASTALAAPPRLRLYRHQDTSAKVAAAAAAKDPYGTIDPPEAGVEGGHGWIRQTLPAEDTFPGGFTWVVMAGLRAPARVTATTAAGTGLGTPPPDKAIAQAEGVAATLAPATETAWEALVVVVTSADSPDPLAEARRRLEAALAGGVPAVQAENRAWLDAFYAQRELTRVISPGGWPGESVQDIYRSRTIPHGGGTRTDIRRFQASAHYAKPECDNQPWNSLPCYNEIFYTYRYVHGWTDAVDMWKQIVQHYQAAAERQAAERFGLPGMFITHGYQPPVRADRVQATAIALEFCLGTMAQLLRPMWDEWDYGGDLRLLREEVYPPFRQAARFYAAYASRGEDGRLHLVPTVLEECWGLTPEFRRNRDAISSLAMARWLLTRTAEAADLLGVDAEEARAWRKVVAELADNPTWEGPAGTVLTGLPGMPNRRGWGDHPWDPTLVPVELADEITLDSPEPLRALGLRTAALWTTPSSRQSRLLLGDPDAHRGWGPGTGAEALLNSRGGTIHLFPSVPADATVSFRGFQARGGFQVSASRTPAGVGEVTIIARRNLPCVIADAWSGGAVQVECDGQPVAVVREGSRLRFDAQAGRAYRIRPGPAR
jgi:hypothetical protein